MLNAPLGLTLLVPLLLALATPATPAGATHKAVRLKCGNATVLKPLECDSVD